MVRSVKCVMKKILEQIKFSKQDYTNMGRVFDNPEEEEFYKYTATLSLQNWVNVTKETHDLFKDEADKHYEEVLKQTIINFLYSEIMDDVIDLEKQLLESGEYNHKVGTKFTKLMNKLSGV